MNDFWEHVLSHLVKQVKELKALVLRGSRQSDLDAETDSWSDTDLLIVLNPADELQKERLFQVIDELGFVVGKEIQGVSEQSVLYRAAVEYEGAVHLLDAHFCSYEEWVSTEAVPGSSFDSALWQLGVGRGAPTGCPDAESV